MICWNKSTSLILVLETENKVYMMALDIFKYNGTTVVIFSQILMELMGLVESSFYYDNISDYL